MRRWMVWARALLVVCGVAVIWPAAAGARVELHRISADPFHNASSQHRSQVEPDTLSVGSTVVGAFQSGRFFNGGASDIGWARSGNGGKTWMHGFLPGVTVYAGGTYDRASDPSVAYDARHHVWLISYLEIVAGGSPSAPVHVDVFVSRSKNGGRSWGAPVAVVIGGSNSSLDKNWSVCDNHASSPFYGHCYTEFDDNAQGDLLLFSTSMDGGQSWGAPVATQGKSQGFAGQPLVQPNGRVVVPIVGFPNPRAYLMQATHSDNGGASWTTPVSISSTLPLFIEKTPVRNPTLPTAEIDRSGRVYVVWEDCRFRPSCQANDLVMSTSMDGVHWSAVKRIPIDPQASHVDEMTPSLAVDPTTSGNHARLALVYYFLPHASCASAACTVRIGYISSRTGGQSWSHRVVLASMHLNWLPFTSQGYMYGDYTGISTVPGGWAVPVVNIARPPSNGLLHAATYAARLPISGGELPTSTTTNPHAALTTPTRTRTTPTAR
jgi:hypothetical protein